MRTCTIFDCDSTRDTRYGEPAIAVKPTTVILSGESGCGKTTVCRRILALAEARRLSVAGILTLPYFVAGRVVGLEVQDVRTGISRPLAMLADHGDTSARRWRFNADGLAWGEAVLQGCGNCDLLLIDELGPLELLQGKGWSGVLDVLRAGRYCVAVAVVRTALAPHFRDAVDVPDLGELLTLSVTPDTRDSVPEWILAMAQGEPVSACLAD
jgi:nucleoside-triphosphatase